MPSRPRLAVGVGLAALVLSLAGCGVGESGWSDLDREPSADDAIPSVVTFGDVVVDTRSIRFVGEHEGTRLWLTKSDVGMCVVQYPDSELWTAACGGGAGLTSGGPGGSFVLVPDGGPVPDGAVKVSANVYSTR